MPSTPQLEHYLAFLRCAAVVSQPPSEIWSERMRRITVTGRIAQIDEDTYDWFLDCLPPHWQGRGFAFAEGREPLRYFWSQGHQHFVRQLTWEETKTFCAAAGIPLPH